jgi:hypothetical protein
MRLPSHRSSRQPRATVRRSELHIRQQVDDLGFLQNLDASTICLERLSLRPDTGRRLLRCAMASKLRRRYEDGLFSQSSRIPMKLLCGPWTQDKIEFLRFLLWITSMSVDWHDSETSQAAVEGRRRAILERNLEAVELFNHNRRLGRAADLEAVYFAVTAAGCDRSIVYDTLLAASLWNTHGKFRHSAELHGWCEARIAEGDPKGTWLQKKLEESRILSNEKEAEQENERNHNRIGRENLDPDTGAYEAGPEDGLIVHQLAWNKVCLHIRILLLSSFPYASFYLCLFLSSICRLDAATILDARTRPWSSTNIMGG